MDLVGSDERNLLRNRLLQSGLTGFQTLSLSIGTVEYPPWFWRSPDQEREAFIDKVFLANASSVISDEGNEFVITTRKPGGGIFDTDSTCIACRFVMMCCFCPGLVATNIVEFSPLMGIKQYATLSPCDIEKQCFKCCVCDQTVPGRLKKPEYLGMLMAIARHRVPESEVSGDLVKVNQFNLYDEMIMRMIDRNDLLVVCNDVVFKGLVNITGPMTTSCYNHREEYPPSGGSIRVFSLARQAGASGSLTEPKLTSIRLRPVVQWNSTGTADEDGIAAEYLWPQCGLESMVADYLKYSTPDLREQVKRSDESRSVAAILCNFCG